ncbi:hypothetical protein [Streptomyces kronopolitis]
MSISGEQNNPYAQPQANPHGQVPAPQNAAVPQQNPYAQQLPQQVPPVPGGGYGYPAGGIPSPPPGPPGAREGAGRGKGGWLWAIGGAVAASAIWASVLFATGGFSDGADPDLAGYGYTDDLCAKTSLTPFENAHFKIKASTSAKDANPQHTGAQQNTMDTMSCNVSLEPQNAGSSDYSSTWTYSTVTLHKKSDPAPEFADSYRSYEKQEASTRYTVEAVPGDPAGHGRQQRRLVCDPRRPGRLDDVSVDLVELCVEQQHCQAADPRRGGDDAEDQRDGDPQAVAGHAVAVGTGGAGRGGSPPRPGPTMAALRFLGCRP